SRAGGYWPKAGRDRDGEPNRTPFFSLFPPCSRWPRRTPDRPSAAEVRSMATDDRARAARGAAVLLTASLLWLAALLPIGAWHASPLALGVTLAITAADLATVLVTLVRRKRVLVGLSV